MMLLSCHGCGGVKDPATREDYPYPDDNVVTDEPLPSFFALGVEPDGKEGRWKKATVCHDCFHRLDPDIWISEGNWGSIGPTVPFDGLPDLVPGGEP